MPEPRVHPRVRPEHTFASDEDGQSALTDGACGISRWRPAYIGTGHCFSIQSHHGPWQGHGIGSSLGVTFSEVAGVEVESGRLREASLIIEGKARQGTYKINKTRDLSAQNCKSAKIPGDLKLQSPTCANTLIFFAFCG